MVEPQPKRRYTMAELLAASDYSQPLSPEEREWVDAPAVGREVIRDPIAAPLHGDHECDPKAG